MNKFWFNLGFIYINFRKNVWLRVASCQLLWQKKWLARSSKSSFIKFLKIDVIESRIIRLRHQALIFSVEKSLRHNYCALLLDFLNFKTFWADFIRYKMCLELKILEEVGKLFFIMGLLQGIFRKLWDIPILDISRRGIWGV